MKFEIDFYGLRQSPQSWLKTNILKLVELGLLPLESDSCAHVQNNNKVVISTLLCRRPTRRGE